MNILPIVELQKEKKQSLLINQDLSQYKLWARKHLELQVKLSSLAEETKCYKYWIDDGLNLNKEAVFIKYTDFLTHVINLGIDKKKKKNYFATHYCVNIYLPARILLKEIHSMYPTTASGIRETPSLISLARRLET